MKLFWIGYDLLLPGRDYGTLTNKLNSLGAQKILYSDWVLWSSSTAVQLRDLLKEHVDHNDRLMVAEVGDWASYNALVNINDVTYASVQR